MMRRRDQNVRVIEHCMREKGLNTKLNRNFGLVFIVETTAAAAKCHPQKSSFVP